MVPNGSRFLLTSREPLGTGNRIWFPRFPGSEGPGTGTIPGGETGAEVGGRGQRAAQTARGGGAQNFGGYPARPLTRRLTMRSSLSLRRRICLLGVRRYLRALLTGFEGFNTGDTSPGRRRYLPGLRTGGEVVRAGTVTPGLKTSAEVRGLIRWRCDSFDRSPVHGSSSYVHEVPYPSYQAAAGCPGWTGGTPHREADYPPLDRAGVHPG